MFRPIPGASLRRPLGCVLLLLCILLPFAGASHAATRARDAAPPTAVNYHLVVVLTGGTSAGTTIEGGVAGMLDATGALTATVVTAIGQTSTITGTLQGSGSPPVLLRLKGAAGTFSLSGATNKAGVVTGMVGTTGSSANVGAWAMTPESTAHTYAFVAKVTSGPDRGTVESGTLVTLTSSAKSDTFDATYYSDDGTTSTAEGRIENHNLEVLLSVTGMGVLMGSAPQTVDTVLGTTFTDFTGTFAGPARGDAGQWSASQTS